MPNSSVSMKIIKWLCYTLVLTGITTCLSLLQTGTIYHNQFINTVLVPSAARHYSGIVLGVIYKKSHGLGDVSSHSDGSLQYTLPGATMEKSSISLAYGPWWWYRTQGEHLTFITTVKGGKDKKQKLEKREAMCGCNKSMCMKASLHGAIRVWNCQPLAWLFHSCQLKIPKYHSINI